MISKQVSHVLSVYEVVKRDVFDSAIKQESMKPEEYDEIFKNGIKKTAAYYGVHESTIYKKLSEKSGKTSNEMKSIIKNHITGVNNDFENVLDSLLTKNDNRDVVFKKLSVL